jgi:hypothetical protein
LLLLLLLLLPLLLLLLLPLLLSDEKGSLSFVASTTTPTARIGVVVVFVPRTSSICLDGIGSKELKKNSVSLAPHCT